MIPQPANPDWVGGEMFDRFELLETIQREIGKVEEFGASLSSCDKQISGMDETSAGPQNAPLPDGPTKLYQGRCPLICVHARPGEGKTSVLQAVAMNTDYTRQTMFVCTSP